MEAAREAPVQLATAKTAFTSNGPAVRSVGSAGGFNCEGVDHFAGVRMNVKLGRAVLSEKGYKRENGGEALVKIKHTCWERGEAEAKVASARQVFQSARAFLGDSLDHKHEGKSNTGDHCVHGGSSLGCLQYRHELPLDIFRV